jgi:hypothetical protein
LHQKPRLRVVDLLGLLVRDVHVFLRRGHGL